MTNTETVDLTLGVLTKLLVAASKAYQFGPEDADEDYWGSIAKALLPELLPFVPPSAHRGHVGALEPFARFWEQWSAKPIQTMDPAYTIYAIHTGTEWAAEITLGDFQRAALALTVT